MKLKTFALALAATTIAGSALAADLPSRKVAPAYIAPAPIMTWSGLYVGLNAGYNWSDSNVVYSGVPVSPPFFPDFGVSSNGVGKVKSSGFIGGAQLGWNLQMGSLVVGLETDIQGLANSGSASSIFNTVPDPAAAATMTNVMTTARKVDWLGTLRGRLGFTVTPSFLLYATGGLAYGGVKATSTWNLVRPAFGLVDIAGTSASGTRLGWTAGVGGEWMFAPNWSAKLEYMYYDLGSITTPVGILVNPTNGNNLALNSSRVKFDGHIVRAGVNYHFNWGGAAPVVAKY